MSKEIEVVAVERGHDGSIVREAGERFHVDEARLSDGSTWFVRVGDEPAAKVVTKTDRPLGSGPTPGSRAK